MAYSVPKKSLIEYPPSALQDGLSWMLSPIKLPFEEFSGAHA
jgi:hypothetical protein